VYTSATVNTGDPLRSSTSSATPATSRRCAPCSPTERRVMTMTGSNTIDPSGSRPTQSRDWSKSPVQRQWAAHTRNGERCKNAAIRGGTICGYHGGRAPAVMTRTNRPTHNNLSKCPHRR